MTMKKFIKFKKVLRFQIENRVLFCCNNKNVFNRCVMNKLENNMEIIQFFHNELGHKKKFIAEFLNDINGWICIKSSKFMLVFVCNVKSKNLHVLKKICILFGPIFYLKKLRLILCIYFLIIISILLLLHVVIFRIESKFIFCVLLIWKILRYFFEKILHPGMNV